MSMIDTLLKGNMLDDLAVLVKENPEILRAATSLLNPDDASVGSGVDLTSVLGALTKGGLGDVVSSWLGKGANQPVDAGRLRDVLGSDVIDQFASHAGIGADQGGSVLAGVLPQLVDQLSPGGQSPSSRDVGELLGGLMSGLQRA